MANQAYQITSPGTLTLLDLGEIPKPSANEVLVRIHAVALNYRDIVVIDHSPTYPLEAKPNLIPGSDGAGVIEEVGPGSRWTKGDHVIIHPSTWTSGINARDYVWEKTLGGGELDGTFRRWMVLSDESLIKAPSGLSMEEASTLFTAGVTAYRALFYGGFEVGPGVNVLTQGTGGVSCYAIMIAAAAGATVIATSSSDEKLEIARKLGAKHLINYRKQPDWATEVLKATDGKGVDITVDVVGAESMEQTVKATAFGGVVCVVGILSKDPLKPVNVINDLLYGGKTLRGQLGAGSRQMGEELSAFMEKHDLHPPIAQLFDFEEATESLKALSNLQTPGKIVFRW